MLEIGLFHNGASSLPVIIDKNGVTFNDGALPEVHRAAQETLVNQVRQGILAEKLEFQSFWLTEHHSSPRGRKMSPNPLMIQMAVPAHKRIRPAMSCATCLAQWEDHRRAGRRRLHRNRCRRGSGHVGNA